MIAPSYMSPVESPRTAQGGYRDRSIMPKKDLSVDKFSNELFSEIRGTQQSVKIFNATTTTTVKIPKLVLTPIATPNELTEQDREIVISSRKRTSIPRINSERN